MVMSKIELTRDPQCGTMEWEGGDVNGNSAE